MTKTLTIDGHSVTMTADARLPIIYRQAFPARNYFQDIMLLSRQKFDGDVLLQFAYTMTRAHNQNTGDFLDWLAQFDDPLAFFREDGPALEIARLAIGTATPETNSDAAEDAEGGTAKNATAGNP